MDIWTRLDRTLESLSKINKYSDLLKWKIFGLLDYFYYYYLVPCTYRGSLYAGTISSRARDSQNFQCHMASLHPRFMRAGKQSPKVVQLSNITRK